MELRCYNFGNFYMSSIQQGIQAAHSQMELFNKYAAPLHATGPDQGSSKSMLFEWSLDHKTMICLNAGDNASMIELRNFLRSHENNYPFATFYESNAGMGGMLTNMALILPEKIFKVAEMMKKRELSWGVLTNNMRNPIKNLIAAGESAQYEIYGMYSEFEIELVNRLVRLGLAR